MKKSILLVTVALVTALFSSCSNNKNVESLESTQDTLSYAYAVGYSQHIIDNYLRERSGARYESFIKGLEDGFSREDTTLNFYALGLNVGSQIRKDATMGLMEDSSLVLNLDIVKAVVMQVLTDSTAEMLLSQDEANAFMQKTIESFEAKAAEKEFGANRAIGEKFLAENAKKENIKVTESGLQYEVISEGKGEKPTATSKVKIHYEGKLIDGTVFDSSIQRKEPAVFAVNQIIPGLTEALQLMPVGSKYKFYIPQELAYGNRGAGSLIAPFSALIFEIELLGIEK